MKALLISEDPEVSEQIQKIIRSNFKKVELIHASSVEETMDIAVSDGPFGFIFLDIDSKKNDSNALANDLYELIGERPILFLGSEGIFTATITDEVFQRSEYNSSILKPITREDFLSELRDIIEKVKIWIKKEYEEKSTESLNPDDYIEMKLRSFYLYDSFPYDIYMAITPTNFMQLLNAGQKYSHSTISQYAKKGVKSLYIHKDEQIKFLESEASYCLNLLSSQSDERDPSQIYLTHLRSITIIHQYLNSLGANIMCNELLDKVSESIINQMSAAISFKSILKDYPEGFGSIASKSLLTAYFSLELANSMEWDSQTTKLKLTVSSILQDYSLPEEELTWVTHQEDPSLVEYNLETNKKFLNHPNSAAQMSSQFSKYSDIDFILANHQELPTREGFPNRPSLTSLTQVNAVFNICQGVASRIDGETIKSESLNNALRSMNDDFNLGVFKEPFKKMREIFKFN